MSVQIAELLNEGQRFESGEKYEKAIRVYVKANILGDVEAAYRIAEIYFMDERTMAESVRYLPRQRRNRRKSWKLWDLAVRRSV